VCHAGRGDQLQVLVIDPIRVCRRGGEGTIKASFVRKQREKKKAKVLNRRQEKGLGRSEGNGAAFRGGGCSRLQEGSATGGPNGIPFLE